MYTVYLKNEFDQGFIREDGFDDEVEAYCDSRNRYRSTQRRIKDKRKYFDEEIGEDRSLIYD